MCCGLPVTGRYIQLLLAELRQDYSERGVELKKLPPLALSGAPGVCEELSRLWSERRPVFPRRDGALTLIAYRQPITRPRSKPSRGSGVSSQIVNTLKDRGWVRSVGHKEWWVARSCSPPPEFWIISICRAGSAPELDPELQTPWRYAG